MSRCFIHGLNKLVRQLLHHNLAARNDVEACRLSVPSTPSDDMYENPKSVSSQIFKLFTEGWQRGGFGSVGKMIAFTMIWCSQKASEFCISVKSSYPKALSKKAVLAIRAPEHCRNGLHFRVRAQAYLPQEANCHDCPEWLTVWTTTMALSKKAAV